jgi:uncharacterized protein YcaQ
MTDDDVAAFRLARHQLTGRSRAPIEAICTAVCGVQAQVMSSAELELWTRNHAVRREDVAQALWTRRSVVKTSAMRQTLHLLSAQDFPVFIAALKRSRMAACARVMARLKVSPAEAADMQDTVLAALSDGPMTQQALVKRAQVRTSRRVKIWLQFATSALRSPIVQGLICYAQPRGAGVTLARTDQWLGPQPTIPEDDAKRELLRRFLGAYGPATVRDFVKWSGIPASEAKPVWDAVSDEMTEVDIDGRRAWILKRDARALKAARGDSETVRLLPAFDVYLLAHSEKDHMIDPRFYKRVYRNQGWLSPVVLQGGRIVAVWSLRSNARSQIVEVEPFALLSRVVKGRIEEEVGALSEYLNAPCSVLFGRD